MLDDAFIMMPEIHVGAVFSEPIVGVVDYDLAITASTLKQTDV